MFTSTFVVQLVVTINKDFYLRPWSDSRFRSSPVRLTLSEELSIKFRWAEIIENDRHYFLKLTALGERVLQSCSEDL